MKTWETAPVVKRGTWLYAGAVRREVRIIRQDSWWGSGDHADPPEIRDNRDVECFRVIYETGDGREPHFADGGQYLTMAGAISAARATLGDSLRWE